MATTHQERHDTADAIAEAALRLASAVRSGTASEQTQELLTEISAAINRLEQSEASQAAALQPEANEETKGIIVRVPASLHKQLKRRAVIEGRSMQSIWEGLLRNYLAT